MKRNLLPITVLVLGALHIIFGFNLGDADGFREPTLARIVVFHLPCAWLTALLVFVFSWFSFQYLRNQGNMDIARRMYVSLDLTLVFAALTLATGIVFSKTQWGQFWSWDPRQTSFLFLFLLMLGGSALRTGFNDESKAHQVTGVFGIALLLPAIFLMFVFPRLEIISGLHPKAATLAWDYRSTVFLGLFNFALISLWLGKQRIAALELLEKQKNHGHDKTHRSRPAVVRLDRTVDVPAED